jgi:hypothetical protein
MSYPITEVRISRLSNGFYQVDVTKEFAPEYGGGSQTFTAPEAVANPHTALDLARSMITVMPCRKEA